MKRKYRSACGWVMAEQVLREHGNDDTYPDGVRFWSSLRNEAIPRDMSLGFTEEDGRRQHVWHGDWIVYEEGGAIYPVREADFSRDHELVQDDGHSYSLAPDTYRAWDFRDEPDEANDEEEPIDDPDENDPTKEGWMA